MELGACARSGEQFPEGRARLKTSSTTAFELKIDEKDGGCTAHYHNSKKKIDTDLRVAFRKLPRV